MLGLDIQVQQDRLKIGVRGRIASSGYIGVMALEAVIEEVLKISAEERTELVARLLDSIDDNADPGHEAAWTGSIDRRMKEIAEERVELVDAADAMAQARAVAAARRLSPCPSDSILTRCSS